MRISDWSSDVCSSDLDRGGFHRLVAAITQRHLTLGIRLKERSRARMAIGRQPFEDLVTVIERGRHEIGGFIAGKAEHDALITRAFILVAAGIDALRDIRGLGVQMVFEDQRLPVEAGLLITDFATGAPPRLFDRGQRARGPWVAPGITLAMTR